MTRNDRASLALFVALWCCFAAGCSQRQGAVERAALPIDSESGQPVVMWLEYDEDVRASGDQAVVFTEPYACYLEWNDQVKRFHLYDRQAKSVSKTADFDAFLGQLAQLPRGTAIQRFDTCTVPRCYGMPDVEWKRLDAILADRDLDWAVSAVNGEKREIVCYCESRGFRFP